MYKVLIVEDEPIVRIGLNNMIHWNDFDMTVVAIAADGQEALAAYFKFRPDVLITDLRMPVMDGITLIKKIRETDKMIRIVILTCLHEFSLVQEALSLGVSSYLLKVTSEPLQIEHVIAKIRNELDIQTKVSMYNGYIDYSLFKEQLMDDFIVYQSLPTNVFSDYVKHLGLRLAEEGLVVAMIRLVNCEKVLKANNDEHGRKFRMAVLKIINTRLDVYNIGEVYMDTLSTYNVIFSVGEMDESHAGELVKRIMSELSAELRKNLGIGVQYGVSSLSSGFIRLPKLRNEAMIDLESHNEQATNHKIVAIEKYISTHYAKNISLQDAAKHVGISTNYLSHLFTQHAGTTFTFFLNNIRVEQAKLLLTQSELTVREIGSNVGFWDATYFIRVFKKVTGFTPDDYRTRMRVCE